LWKCVWTLYIGQVQLAKSPRHFRGMAIYLCTKVANSPCPLSKSNSCFQIFMKLGKRVYGYDILVKFDNQANRSSHFREMERFYKNDIFVLSARKCWLIFMKLGERVYVHNISTKSDNSQIASAISELWRFIYTKMAT